MRKTVKLVSAMLVLVMLLAQVVCINAASVKPSVSFSTKQIDHYEKTCTVTLTNVKDVSHIWIAAYRADKTTKIDEATKYIPTNSDNVTKVTVSLDVFPNDAKYIHCTVHLDDGTTIDKWFSVGGNTPFTMDNTTSNGGSYDGLTPGGSFGDYEIYDPDKWYGYYEDEPEVKDYDYYYVTCRSLNVRNGAGTWADRVGSLKRYDKVKVYDIEDGWAVIEYDGHLRFVSVRYLSKY